MPVLIPAFKYTSQKVTIGATNNKITFREQAGVDIVGTVASGSFSYGQLAAEVRKAMVAAGAVAAYTWRYSYSTQKYTTTSDLTGGATIYSVMTGGANDIAATLGITSNKTGATSYTSDAAVPSLTTLTLTRNIRGPRLVPIVERADEVLETGVSESLVTGDIDTYSFRLEYETVASALGFYDMWKNAASRGAVIQFYPNSTNMSNWVDVVFVDKQVDIRDMSDQGAYQLFLINFNVRGANPNTGNLTTRDLINREA